MDSCVDTRNYTAIRTGEEGGGGGGGEKVGEMGQGKRKKLRVKGGRGEGR